jgi:molybdopterin/thiamine biosynthesis adenylyltransferase
VAWFDTSPERLTAEATAFTDLGWPWDIDGAARQAGRLVVRTRATFDGTEYALEVRYPPSYPLFPPTVVNLGPPTGTRHEHPLEHTLCLLRDHGRQWKPHSDRAAVLIHDKLPDILRINADPLGDFAVAKEARQAEPFSAYLPYQPGSHVAMPPLDGVPVAQGIARLKLFGHEPYRGFLTGLALGGRAVDYDLSIKKPIVEVEVPVVPLAQVPQTWEPEELWDLACSELGRPPNWTTVKNRDVRWPKKVRALALMYPDELQWRRTGPNLTLLIERRNAESVNGKYIHLAAVRTEFESAAFRQERVPELRVFPQQKVALFGTGALGSFLAMELARSGIGRLSMLDCDDLTSGNTVRWALGRNYVGNPKVAAIANEISQAYPHTQVKAVGLRLGADNTPGDEAKLLDEMLAGADIVVDATASLRVNDYLSRRAHERGLPYIWLSTTNGAWGGMVGRVRPSGHTCWMCHRHHMTEGGAIEPPVQKPGELDVQPAGCLDPTFTGTAFDANEVVLQAVRLIASTLCSSTEGGYPDYSWDIATVSLRTPEGQPSVPQWTTYPLEPHPDCCGESVA